MTDSGKILDSAEVEFLLGASDTEDAKAPGEEAGTEERSATMRGNLDQINLADIFQTLAMTKMEGVLRVHNPLEQRQVYCRDGTVRILMPSREIQRRIGQRLISAGLITGDQLRLTLLRQRDHPKPLGELLIDDQLVTPEQVDEIVHVQVTDDLFNLLTWTHGIFEFYKGPVRDEELRTAFAPCPEFDVSSLLLDVARRSDEWDGIIEAIRNLDEVPRPCVDDCDQELDELEYALFRAADGMTTYRQLAEQTSEGVFDVARAARNLVNSQVLCNLSDEEMVAAASDLTDSGMTKRALMLLQVLRERPGDRELDIVRRIASVLERCKERRGAGLVLLEAAQLQTDSTHALALAKDACAYAPQDAGTLSFLRTTLLAHSPPDSELLEKTTLELLDALIQGGRYGNAIEICEDARATQTANVGVLSREARARHKNHDGNGAIAIYQEIAEIHRANGDTRRLSEAYEAILRVDRTRHDIRRLLYKSKRSRADRLIRVGAALICAVLLGSMGLVIWQQHRLDEVVRAASADISALLRAGDRQAARDRLGHWSTLLEGTEAIEDLRRQVDFAHATELQRRTRLAHKIMQQRLSNAAESIRKGELESALETYNSLWRDPAHRATVNEVIRTRITALVDDIEETAKTMVTRLPPSPNNLQNRQELTLHLATLQEMCSPTHRKLTEALTRLHGEDRLPDCLDNELRAHIATVITATKDTYASSRQLAEAYTAALQRNDSHRRYDPIFKAALRREEQHDFAGALELFRQLEKVDEVGPEMRAVFRDHVTRNATICKLMDELQNATDSGDFATAHQQMRALGLLFPDVPFETLVRLPLRIETQPPGATVRCNGTVIDKSPCTIAYVPAEPNGIEITLHGFATYKASIDAVTGGVLHLRLHYLPQRAITHKNTIDTAPTADESGRTYLVDRSGVVTAIRSDSGEQLWSFRSGDLSGLLSQVFRYQELAVVASLDGDLRALSIEDGTVAWSIPDLPSEAPAVQAGQHLLLATTDNRLCRVNLDTRAIKAIPIPGQSPATLATDGIHVFSATRESVTAHTVQNLKRAWQLDLEKVGERYLAVADEVLVIVDDLGNIACHETRSGRRLWHRRENDLIPGRPVVDNDAVLLASPQKIMRLGLAEGRTRREIPMLEGRWRDLPIRIGRRLLATTADNDILVLDGASGKVLYAIEGGNRDTVILPWQQGALVALPDRRLHFYPSLR